MNLQHLVKAFLRLALRAYFRRIELFHAERVPGSGPVIFASNHPNSITDAFVIGTSVPRPVFFIATVQLFRFTPLAWFLTRCGVIPVNRLKDDASAMRSVLATFEACFRVLERGEAIGIFPEGITHDDPQLKAIKTGAARMALELEHRHGGKLGLQLVPVGLTFAEKPRYRSHALVHFGEPIRVADHLGGYADRRKECISALNELLQKRLQSLIVHIPRLEHVRVVSAVKRLYLERLRVGNRVIQEPLSPQAEELVLTQAITEAVEFAFKNCPDRTARFVHRLTVYEGWLRRLKLSDETVSRVAEQGAFAAVSLGRAILAVLGAPVALYGWLHRLAPLAVVRAVAGHFARAHGSRAQFSSVAIVAGLLSFGVFYALYVWIARHFLSLPATLAYALSLPGSGLLAHCYLCNARQLAHGVWDTLVLLRLPFLRQRLRAWRGELINEIEAVRGLYRDTLERQASRLP
jgi:1-acyl-sn-glycerol-3-phosphate acyltransferase